MVDASFEVGQRLAALAEAAAAGQRWIQGQVTAYIPGSQRITVEVRTVAADGTAAVKAITCEFVGLKPAVGATAWLVYLGSGRWLCTGQQGSEVHGQFSGTTDASGYLNVAHKAPWTPSYVGVTPRSPIVTVGGVGPFGQAIVDTVGPTTFRVRCLQNVGPALATIAVTGFYHVLP